MKRRQQKNKKKKNTIGEYYKRNMERFKKINKYPIGKYSNVFFLLLLLKKFRVSFDLLLVLSIILKHIFSLFIYCIPTCKYHSIHNLFVIFLFSPFQRNINNNILIYEYLFLCILYT